MSPSALSRREDACDLELQLFWGARANELLDAAIAADAQRLNAKRRAGQRNGIQRT